MQPPVTSPRPLTIGFATRQDARDARSWSGVPYQMAQALSQAGGEIHYIGPMSTEALSLRRHAQGIRRRLGAKTLLPVQSLAASRSFGKQISEAISKERPDLVFSPVGSAMLSSFHDDVPVVYSSDATYRLMRGYYPKYSVNTSRAARQADEIERRTIERADLIVYPTDWVAQSAIEHYGADPSKVHVVPYGANVEPPERESALAERPSGPIQLLFVGVDWARKGGNIAVAALDDLNARGRAAELTVIGCRPPDSSLRPEMTVVPFLDKNDPSDRRRMADFYLAADFFVLPTRQECYGIVFCEAAAYGLPSLATDTGGVSGAVREGVTGHLLPSAAGGPEYADVVERILAAPGGLEALRQTARDEYETRLNWGAWAESVYGLMRTVVDS